MRTIGQYDKTSIFYWLNHVKKIKHLLCNPVLTPQTAGIGGPPDTTNWSLWQTWSVDSGWASTKLSKSKLQDMMVFEYIELASYLKVIKYYIS